MYKVTNQEIWEIENDLKARGIDDKIILSDEKITAILLAEGAAQSDIPKVLRTLPLTKPYKRTERAVRVIVGIAKLLDSRRCV
jgi:hypothetical protein